METTNRLRFPGPRDEASKTCLIPARCKIASPICAINCRAREAAAAPSTLMAGQRTTKRRAGGGGRGGGGARNRNKTSRGRKQKKKTHPARQALTKPEKQRAGKEVRS